MNIREIAILVLLSVTGLNMQSIKFNGVELAREIEVATETNVEPHTEATETTTEEFTEMATESPEIAEIEVTEDSGDMYYYSTYEVTAYEYTGNPCADGEWPIEWYTAASNDSNLWHKNIYIEDVGYFFVMDTGGMASDVVDIYLGDYDTCINFGRQVHNIYILD